MPFSVRGFLRQVSAKGIREFLGSRQIAVPDRWWSEKGSKVAARVADYLLTTHSVVCDRALAELGRADAMATERGRKAFINASAHDIQITSAFGALENDADRAVWMLTAHADLFREAEELLFFDYHSERRQGRHYTTEANLEVSRQKADVDLFKEDLRAFYRRQDGSGVSCEVEFFERHGDQCLQVSIYVQGLPAHATEFAEGTFVRRVSTPALEAAIVYEPATGATDTVARGGRDVHEAIRDAFARRLLKVTDPRFGVARKRSFQLDSLKEPRELPADPSLGVKSVRVRALRLVPPGFRRGQMLVEAPGGDPTASVHDVANAWFTERSGVYRRFSVVHATISMHFEAEVGRKRAKTINIELTRPNNSNLKDLPEAERRIAEAHIERWGLIESIAQ